jgi:LPS export ABC transporter protein LptC
MVRACVRELEAMIRCSPADWAWIHPRWPEERAPEAVRGAETRPADTAGPQAAPIVRTGAAACGMIGLTLLAALLLSACGQTRPPQAERKDDPGLASALGEFRLRETVDGRLRWVLTADSADTFEPTNQTVVLHLRVDFYNDSADVYSVLTADRGVVQRSNNDMTARGNVRLVTRAGDTLTTEVLDWNNLSSRVRTTESFRLGRPGGVLTGVGFESDPGIRNYTTEDVRIDARSGNHAGGS